MREQALSLAGPCLFSKPQAVSQSSALPHNTTMTDTTNPHNPLQRLIQPFLDHLATFGIFTELSQRSALVLLAGMPLVYADMLNASTISLRLFSLCSQTHTLYTIDVKDLDSPQGTNSVSLIALSTLAEVNYATSLC